MASPEGLDDLFVIIVGEECSVDDLPIKIKEEYIPPDEVSEVKEVLANLEQHTEPLYLTSFPIKEETVDNSSTLDEFADSIKVQFECIDGVKNEESDTNGIEYPETATEEFLDGKFGDNPDNTTCEYPDNNACFQDVLTEFLVLPLNQNADVKNTDEFHDSNLDSSCALYGGDKKNSRKLRKADQRKSFIKELKETYPELEKDKELLISSVTEIMREIKVPEIPPDSYFANECNFECVICGALTETEPAACRHFQEKHGPRYLTCFACGMDFRSRTNLYKHEKRCTGYGAKIVLKARARFLGRKGQNRPFLQHIKGLWRPKPKTHTSFECSLCPAVFSTKATLMSHEYLHRGERPHRCSLCNAAYTSKTALSRHLITHTDQKFICDTCSREFKSKATIIAHMDTHRPIKKFGCTECEKRFAQKFAMDLHIRRVHRGMPMPCACQVCPKRYPRMSLLKTHMMKEHGMLIMTRNMFFKSLPKLSDQELLEAQKMLQCEKTAKPDRVVLIKNI